MRRYYIPQLKHGSFVAEDLINAIKCQMINVTMSRLREKDLTHFK